MAVTLLSLGFGAACLIVLYSSYLGDDEEVMINASGFTMSKANFSKVIKFLSNENLQRPHCGSEWQKQWGRPFETIQERSRWRPGRQHGRRNWSRVMPWVRRGKAVFPDTVPSRPSWPTYVMEKMITGLTDNFFDTSYIKAVKTDWCIQYQWTWEEIVNDSGH